MPKLFLFLLATIALLPAARAAEYGDWDHLGTVHADRSRDRDTIEVGGRDIYSAISFSVTTGRSLRSAAL